MVRRYILFGLLIAEILPAYTNAAEFRPAQAKPILLIVNEGLDSLTQLVTSIVAPIFNVQSILLSELALYDLNKVIFVLINTDAGVGPEYKFSFGDFTQIAGNFEKKGLAKEIANKAFVLIRREHKQEGIETFDRWAKGYFSRGLFELTVNRATKTFERDEQLDKFTKFLQSLTNQFKQGQLQLISTRKTPIRELLEKSNEFYDKLNSVAPALANEYFGLMGQMFEMLKRQ